VKSQFLGVEDFGNHNAEDISPKVLVLYISKLVVMPIHDLGFVKEHVVAFIVRFIADVVLWGQGGD
jgi:hypothetical protein